MRMYTIYKNQKGILATLRSQQNINQQLGELLEGRIFYKSQVEFGGAYSMLCLEFLALGPFALFFLLLLFSFFLFDLVYLVQGFKALVSHVLVSFPKELLLVVDIGQLCKSYGSSIDSFLLFKAQTSFLYFQSYLVLH